MSNHSKVNILVLVDEENYRYVFNIHSYIFFKEQHFILVTNDKQFELLRIFNSDKNLTLLEQASEDEISHISDMYGYKIDRGEDRKEYKTVGLMFSEENQNTCSHEFNLKISRSEEYINLLEYIPILMNYSK